MAYSSSEVSDQHFDCVPIEDHVTRVSSEFNRSFAYSLPQQLMIDRSDIGSLRRVNQLTHAFLFELISLSHSLIEYNNIRYSFEII